jgi:hypothetical protein
MKMKKHTIKKRKPFFNPDEIATAISQTLNRDLGTSTQLYGGPNELQRFYSITQKESCLKKYDPFVGNSKEVLQEEAFTAFLETNARMREVNEKLSVPCDMPAHLLHPTDLAIRRAAALCRWVLRDITWGELADHATHSGGVTRGVSFADTSLEAKFTWPLSTTREVTSIYRQYLIDNVQLRDAIEILNRQSGEVIQEEFDIVEESRATTVPKSATKRRMIAIEPTLNMFFQQSLMAIMYNRLKEVGLDVESLPSWHQDLAFRGSVTGKTATIDFSSASDCVSIELLRQLLPDKWFRYVVMFRCPRMNIRGESVELHMISTMGNAGTFPLETLVFWSLGVAAIMQDTRTNPYSLLSTEDERAMVSVFGDDCILPTIHAETFMSLCGEVGFRVNQEKSFYDPGPGFRESCGGDYYHGANVRPFMLKAPTSTRRSALEPWLYITLNAILPKYISYFGRLTYVYDKDLLAYLFSLFTKHKILIKLVPSDFPDDAGLKTTDWQRIRQCYGVKFDTVATSAQGWLSFRYCRFQYKTERDRDDFLRYAIWLKAPRVSRLTWHPKPKPELLSLFPIRRKGGYIVAKALYPNWGI